MARGALSFFALSALSLWTGVFFTGAVPGILFPLAGLAVISAAIPIFSVENLRWKRAGMALSFLGLGLLIGGLRIPEKTRWERYSSLLPGSVEHTAVALQRVEGFKGILVADSTALPVPEGTLSRYPIKLEEVVSRDGQFSGSARGTVLLLVRDGPMLFRGQEVIVNSGLERSRQPGRFAYTARADVRELRPGGFPGRVDRFRAGVFADIQSRLRRLDPEVDALLQALALGRREELGASLYEKFRTAGSLHLLALSGLHLGILFFLLNLALRFVRDRRLRRVAAGCLLLGYVFLVGWRPSLERAAVMLLFAVAGYTLDREIQPLDLLGAAAVALLLIHPHYAYDLSFQLSFLSLAAIVLLSPCLYRIWQRHLPPFLGWPLGVSLSAQFGTAPLVLYHFGAIYPIGVVAALLLIPLVTVFLGTGVLYLLSTFLPLPPGSLVADQLLANVLRLVYRAISLCLELFSRAPGLYLPWRSLYWLLLSILLVPKIFQIRMQRRIPAC
jgi:ComEC/Rec2-related protein